MHKFPFETVIYWNDLKTDAQWSVTREIVLRAGIDGVDFYYIREHELRHLPLEVVLSRIERLKACVAELRSSGLRVGGALLPSLGWGQAVEEGPFEKITGPDGQRAGTGSCPLDPTLRTYLCRIVRSLADAGFDHLSLEDDYQNDNHRPVKHGCFCERHLAAFSAREQRRWTRLELAAALDADGTLRDRWNTFRMDVLCELGRTLYDVARWARPEIETRLMAGGDVNANAAPLLQALACRQWRPGQGYYTEHSLGPLLGAWSGHIVHRAVRSEVKVDAVAEITSWPRNAFAKSWTTHMLQTALSAFLDFDAALFWAGLGPRDTGFGPAMVARRGWFERLAAERETHPRHIGLPVAVERGRGRSIPAGAVALARMGFAVVLVAPDDLPPGAPLALLGPVRWPNTVPLSGRPLVIDAEAVALAQEALPEIHGCRGGVFHSCERHTDDEINGDSSGYYSTCLTLLTANDLFEIESENGVGMASSPDSPLRVLSEFLDNDSQPVAPAVVLDEGRRRLLLAYGEATWGRLISLPKAEQFARALRRLLKEPLPRVTGAADLLVFAREGAASVLVLLINLSHDAAADWRLELSGPVIQTWEADDSGTWRRLDEGDCPVRGRPSPVGGRASRLLRFEREMDTAFSRRHSNNAVGISLRLLQPVLRTHQRDCDDQPDPKGVSLDAGCVVGHYAIVNRNLRHTRSGAAVPGAERQAVLHPAAGILARGHPLIAIEPIPFAARAKPW